MSETKKLEELLTGIQNDLTELKKWKNEHSQSAEKHTNSKPPHTHSANVVFDCPECEELYKQDVVAKATPEILKAQREKIKNMEDPQRCEDCGEVYDREENEECPTCKGREEE